jgi:hypothetical protein
VSFSALPTGPTGAYFAHFKDAATTTGLRCRIFVSTNGAAPGCVRVGVAAGANIATAWLTQDIRLNTRHRLVCRMALANNQSTLWLNPKTEADSSVISSDESAAKIAVAFAFRESAAGGAGMGELAVDNLVVATTFSEMLAAEAPVIDLAPASQTVLAGGPVLFRVRAFGSQPMTYQWLHDGVEVTQASEPDLFLASVGATDAGPYQVCVENAAGSVTSPEALLIILFEDLAASIRYDPWTGVRLDWAARPEQIYSVWAADSVNGVYSMVADGLVFWEGRGVFEDGFPSAPSRFYRVGIPSWAE